MGAVGAVPAGSVGAQRVGTLGAGRRGTSADSAMRADNAPMSRTPPRVEPAEPRPPATLRLRAATPADVPRLAALYAASARTLGPAVYDAAQVEAWAGFGADSAAFRSYVMGADTWLAEARTAAGEVELLGFSGWSRAGHGDHAVAGDGTPGDVAEVHSLYVAAGRTRAGVGTRLLAATLERIEAAGLVRAAAWVTPFSRPVFARAGFVVEAVVQTTWQGIAFERTRMVRR